VLPFTGFFLGILGITTNQYLELEKISVASSGASSILVPPYEIFKDNKLILCRVPL